MEYRKFVSVAVCFLMLTPCSICDDNPLLKTMELYVKDNFQDVADEVWSKYLEKDIEQYIEEKYPDREMKELVKEHFPDEDMKDFVFVKLKERNDFTNIATGVNMKNNNYLDKEKLQQLIELGKKPDTRLSQQCNNDILTMMFSLNVGEEWASMMWNAWASPEPGAYGGNSIWEGRNLQCNKVDAKRIGSDGKPFRGRFCSMMWPQWWNWYDPAGYSMCLPSSCNATDLWGLMATYVVPFGLPLPFWFPVSNGAFSGMCEEERLVKDDPAAIGAISVYSFFILLGLIGTLYDIITWNKRHPSATNEVNRNNKAINPVQDTTYYKRGDETIDKENQLSDDPNVSTQTQTHVNQAYNDKDDAVPLPHLEVQLSNETVPAYVSSYSDGVRKVFRDPEFTNTNETKMSEAMNAPNGLSTNYPVNGFSAGTYPGQNIVIQNQDNGPIKLQQNVQMVESMTSEVYKPNTCEQILLAFAIPTNISKLLSFEAPKGSYRCLNGIRFMTMCSILLGHTWQLGIIISDAPTVENRYHIGEFTNRGTHSIINNSNYCVETFFVLSAMLTTISFLKQVKRHNGKPPCSMFGIYYFHRYWRLTPVYMMLLMFWAVLFPYLRSGPLFPSYINGIEVCKDVWWKHLIYLNNLWDARLATDCFGWSWYLANDFQFYVFAPVILSLLYWVPIAGIVVNVLCILGSITAWGYLNANHTVHYEEIYIKPWTRCITYLMGIFLGYAMFKTNCKMNMHKAGVAVLWIISLGCVLIPLYVSGKTKTDVGWVAFESLNRPMFALGLMWIIFACCSGNGGPINTILSWSGWIPLAKLTYTGYLIHPMFVYYTYYSTPVQIIMTDWNLIYYFLGHLMLTLGTATVVSLFLEIPFVQLEKVMLQNVKR